MVSSGHAGGVTRSCRCRVFNSLLIATHGTEVFKVVYVHPHRRKGRYVRGHYRRPPSRRAGGVDVVALLFLMLLLGAALSR